MPRHYHDWCDWCHTSTHNTFHCRSKRSYCKNCDRNGHHTNNCYYFDEHGKPRVGDAPSDAPRGLLCDPRRASEDERLASGHGRRPVRQATDARDRSCELPANNEKWILSLQALGELHANRHPSDSPNSPPLETPVRPPFTRALLTQPPPPPGARPPTPPPPPPCASPLPEQVTVAGAEAPHNVHAQARKDVAVPTTADTAPTPTVPVCSSIQGLSLPGRTLMQGSMSSITPSIQPPESPKWLESNVFAPRNNKNLHRDPSGVPTRPRGQPADHVGLADSLYAMREDAAVQRKNAAEQDGAEAGGRQTELPTTVVPPVLENEHSLPSVSQNATAPDTATSRPISKKAKCSIAQRGGRRKPGLSREEVASRRAAAASKAGAKSQAGAAEAVCRPPKDMVTLQKPSLVSGAPSQRASDSPQVAARTLTVAPKVSEASSKGLHHLSTSALLSPPPEKACAPATTYERSKCHASTTNEPCKQRSRSGGQPRSLDRLLLKRKRVVNMSSDESDTEAVEAASWSTSGKDAPAKEVQTEDASALALDMAGIEHVRRTQARQEAADPDYHPPADGTSEEDCDKDSERAPLMFKAKGRRSQAMNKPISAERMTSPAYVAKETLAPPLPKKSKVSKMPDNAFSVANSKSTPGLAVKRKDDSAPAGSSHKPAITTSSSTTIAKKQQMATSPRSKSPYPDHSGDDSVQNVPQDSHLARLAPIDSSWDSLDDSLFGSTQASTQAPLPLDHPAAPAKDAKAQQSRKPSSPPPLTRHHADQSRPSSDTMHSGHRYGGDDEDEDMIRLKLQEARLRSKLQEVQLQSELQDLQARIKLREIAKRKAAA